MRQVSCELSYIRILYFTPDIAFHIFTFQWAGRCPPKNVPSPLIMVYRVHSSPHPKRILDRFTRFCRAHSCDRETDRHRDRQQGNKTDRQMDIVLFHRPCSAYYVGSAKKQPLEDENKRTQLLLTSMVHKFYVNITYQSCQRAVPHNPSTNRKSPKIFNEQEHF